jgi:hypothetical protein
MRLLIVTERGDAVASRRSNFKRTRVWLMFLPCAVVMPTSSCGGHRAPGVEVSVSPCVLGNSPTRFDGQTVKLTGYVTSTKEGAYIWDEGCQSSGILLWMTGPVASDKAFRNLLSQYGLSDSPIRATLRGSFRYNRFTRVKRFDAVQVLESHLGG